MTSRGARSGRDVTTPLVYRRWGNEYVVVASEGGAPDRVTPNGPERDRLYAYMTEIWPAFSDYANRTARTIPVVVLQRIA